MKAGLRKGKGGASLSRIRDPRLEKPDLEDHGATKQAISNRKFNPRGCFGSMKAAKSVFPPCLRLPRPLSGCENRKLQLTARFLTLDGPSSVPGIFVAIIATLILC
ncbi:hypothetical protein K227x_38290 [Rubripirellula lacrimiformis]|uniref:Uncharacterized protein n=1 Tax=Rubripirellula lacrimiformis TaxID=1930273 RepID=A0A517NE74_9BACT|nr:hypothetical protein K227x_38290 [Rubripirellula lacrimiformis]